MREKCIRQYNDKGSTLNSHRGLTKSCLGLIQEKERETNLSKIESW